MALSYYSNWGTQVVDHLKQDQTSSLFFPQEDLLLPQELLNFHDNFDTCIDTLFSQNNLFYHPHHNVDAYTTLSPSPVPLDTQLPPLPPQEMIEEDACFDHYSKRIKIQENHFFYPDMTIHSNYNNNLNEGSSNDNDVKKAAASGGWGGSLSQQSIAARMRRRKITEKTQELGKLIPGGHKMNTAEMFQAAFKYIKLLQAQLGLVQLMQLEENDEEGGIMYSTPELEALVTSPLVQQKLYSAEKCLVPTHFVKRLTQNPQLHSNPQLIKDLIKLI